MNAKTISLVASILLSSLGCSTLPRPDVVSAGALAGNRVALASGPALVHISTNGSGTARLYLADDDGIGSALCPSAAAENAVPIRILDGESNVSDLPVPAGKRVCAVFDARELSVNWLWEDYSVRTESPARVSSPAPLLIAKR
jgi:hypothetical protein